MPFPSDSMNAVGLAQSKGSIGPTESVRSKVPSADAPATTDNGVVLGVVKSPATAQCNVPFTSSCAPGIVQSESRKSPVALMLKYPLSRTKTLPLDGPQPAPPT